jgi:hypothetical protein
VHVCGGTLLLFPDYFETVEYEKEKNGIIRAWELESPLKKKQDR